MNIITVVFCVLVVFNFAMAVPTMIARKQSEMNTVQYTDGNSPEADSEMPNIYYLLFDEYSGYNFMLKYYEYDNSVFIEKLKSKNFSVSYSSYNESVSTETVITNLMNLNYVVDDSWTSYDKSEVRKNGELYKLLTKHGYKLYSLTDRYGLPLIDEQEGENEAVTISGETLRSILIKNTVVYPLLSVNRQGLQTTIDSIERFICREEKSRFFISHLLLPHQPFIFDRDGNIIKNVNTNWKDKKYYLDQFIYATKVMEELIDCILKHDPDSIIILQSDHSARASTDSDIFKVVFKMEDMTNCFNCVYYMGKPVDIEGLSGVNTDRLLLSMLLDEELPPLEVPRLEVNGFDKGE
ncbi:MAG: hypothetical protein K6F61_08795 [Clostridiales bacterium]|nr:hypothetical protein [Clostridiales bacterium]